MCECVVKSRVGAIVLAYFYRWRLAGHLMLIECELTAVTACCTWCFFVDALVTNSSLDDKRDLGHFMGS